MKTSMACLAILFVILSVHCYPAVSEGDRCNIALSHNECANDPVVQCVVPTNCANAYCCSPTSTSPNCQACPVSSDGGTDGGFDAGEEGGQDAAAPDGDASSNPG